MKKLLTLATVASLAFGVAAQARELSLAYFMGPKHPMNAAVFTPFAERLAELSGGELTVKQFPGGALNSVPPKQYSILLDGVADIVFTLPGYTGETFPKTNVINLPGICTDSITCTEALQRAKSELESEYQAKLLVIWANSPPILLTKDKPVRTLEDLQGLKLRVTSSGQVPFVDALGSSPIGQPVNVLNQNISNGVIDAISIDPSGIASYKLQEVTKYLTTFYPGSGSAFVMLMNQDVYDSLSEEEKGWVAQASEGLAESGAIGFEASTQYGLKLSREAGLEFIDIGKEEEARWQAVVDARLKEVLSEPAGDGTVEDVYKLMKGE